jgi:hypothetical protein
MESQLLSAIEDALNSDGINYSVFLRAYAVPVDAKRSSEDCVRRALGERTIPANFQRIGSAEIIQDVRSALRFAGDAGAGPSPRTVGSNELAERLNELSNELKHMAANASCTERFEMLDGHPAYPVFWEFSYLFRFDSEAVVLIGAASD